jgi:hypothetical protein
LYPRDKFSGKVNFWVSGFNFNGSVKILDSVTLHLNKKVEHFLTERFKMFVLCFVKVVTGGKNENESLVRFS